MLVARVGDDVPTRRSWPVDRYSQHRSATAAAGASRSCRRTTSRSTARSAGARSARAWARSTAPTPRCLIPDGRKSLRGGAVAVWPDFAENPAFARLIAALAEAQGIDLDMPFDELAGRQRRALLHGTGETWFTVPAGSGQPTFSFQYKGLFPAIEEAARVSFIYRYKLQGMVDDVPCAACMGAAAPRRRRRRPVSRLDPRPDRPVAAGPDLRLLQGAEARAATNATSPATWSARSATASSSWSTSGSTTCRSPAARRRSRAARASGSAWPARSAAA